MFVRVVLFLELFGDCFDGLGIDCIWLGAELVNRYQYILKILK